jgi:hypothetical protein
MVVSLRPLLVVVVGRVWAELELVKERWGPGDDSLVRDKVMLKHVHVVEQEGSSIHAMLGVCTCVLPLRRHRCTTLYNP